MAKNPNGSEINQGFSKGKRDALVQALREGLTITAACGVGRVTAETYYVWMKAGIAPDASEEKKQFVADVSAAISEFEKSLTRSFIGFAADDWRACESILKRRFRKDWGDPQVGLTGDTGPENDLTKEQWAALVELISKAKL